MAWDEEMNVETDSADSYEAAVLDLLNSEMAVMQSPRKEIPQTDELDALVSDLLKQVLIEEQG
jgi:hypothetical protein